MISEDKIGYWVKISDEDLKIAGTMLENHYHLYTGFMCHQAIEKIFKAGFEKLKNDTPPCTHKLSSIALQAGFMDKLTEAQLNFIFKIEPLNIEARYPSYKNMVASQLDDNECKDIIEQTQALQQWVKTEILSTK